MPDLSPTDIRVIEYLRGGRRKTSGIARQCFETKNARPAAAHLARMKERGLVQSSAGMWELTDLALNPSPELFPVEAEKLKR